MKTTTVKSKAVKLIKRKTAQRAKVTSKSVKKANKMIEAMTMHSPDKVREVKDAGVSVFFS